MPETETEETTTNVQTPEYEELAEQSVPSEENLDILLDINMPITVNIGKTIIPFRQLLQLGPGSVLPLDKAIGQPAELYVQDIKFATGDIVVVDGCFAVRIRDILGADNLESGEE